MPYKLVFAVFGLASILSGEVSSDGSSDLPTRGVCAYRGASNTCPENTLTAYREAIRLGAHMVEMDVRFTKDQQPVLMHDVTVDRTTNGSGAVSELTLEEIKRLDAGIWKSSRFEGEKVPTLEEVLQTMPLTIWIFIHLKGGREAGERVAQTIVEQESLHQTVIICNSEVASAALKVDSSIMTLGTYQWFLKENFRERNDGNKRLFLGLFQSDLKQGIPEDLEDSNISIFYYDPVILPNDLPSLFEAGVHFIASPDVDVLVKAASKHGIRPLKPHYATKD
jgi:glycerophosphoryl diester phosphodiesterase